MCYFSHLSQMVCVGWPVLTCGTCSYILCYPDSVVCSCKLLHVVCAIYFPCISECAICVFCVFVCAIVHPTAYPLISFLIECALCSKLTRTGCCLVFCYNWMSNTTLEGQHQKQPTHATEQSYNWMSDTMLEHQHEKQPTHATDQSYNWMSDTTLERQHEKQPTHATDQSYNWMSDTMLEHQHEKQPTHADRPKSPAEREEEVPVIMGRRQGEDPHERDYRTNIIGPWGH